MDKKSVKSRNRKYPNVPAKVQTCLYKNPKTVERGMNTELSQGMDLENREDHVPCLNYINKLRDIINDITQPGYVTLPDLPKYLQKAQQKAIERRRKRPPSQSREIQTEKPRENKDCTKKTPKDKKKAEVPKNALKVLTPSQKSRKEQEDLKSSVRPDSRNQRKGHDEEQKKRNCEKKQNNTKMQSQDYHCSRKGNNHNERNPNSSNFADNQPRQNVVKMPNQDYYPPRVEDNYRISRSPNRMEINHQGQYNMNPQSMEANFGYQPPRSHMSRNFERNQDYYQGGYQNLTQRSNSNSPMRPKGSNLHPEYFNDQIMTAQHFNYEGRCDFRMENKPKSQEGTRKQFLPSLVIPGISEDLNVKPLDQKVRNFGNNQSIPQAENYPVYRDSLMQNNNFVQNPVEINQPMQNNVRPQNYTIYGDSPLGNKEYVQNQEMQINVKSQNYPMYQDSPIEKNNYVQNQAEINQPMQNYVRPQNYTSYGDSPLGMKDYVQNQEMQKNVKFQNYLMYQDSPIEKNTYVQDQAEINQPMQNYARPQNYTNYGDSPLGKQDYVQNQEMMQKNVKFPNYPMYQDSPIEKNNFVQDQAEINQAMQNNVRPQDYSIFKSSPIEKIMCMQNLEEINAAMQKRLNTKNYPVCQDSTITKSNYDENPVETIPAGINQQMQSNSKPKNYKIYEDSPEKDNYSSNPDQRIQKKPQKHTKRAQNYPIYEDSSVESLVDFKQLIQQKLRSQKQKYPIYDDSSEEHLDEIYQPIQKNVRPQKPRENSRPIQNNARPCQSQQYRLPNQDSATSINSYDENPAEINQRKQGNELPPELLYHPQNPYAPKVQNKKPQKQYIQNPYEIKQPNQSCSINHKSASGKNNQNQNPTINLTSSILPPELFLEDPLNPNTKVPLSPSQEKRLMLLLEEKLKCEGINSPGRNEDSDEKPRRRRRGMGFDQLDAARAAQGTQPINKKY